MLIISTVLLSMTIFISQINTATYSDADRFNTFYVYLNNFSIKTTHHILILIDSTMLLSMSIAIALINIAIYSDADRFNTFY